MNSVFFAQFMAFLFVLSFITSGVSIMSYLLTSRLDHNRYSHSYNGTVSNYHKIKKTEYLINVLYVDKDKKQNNCLLITHLSPSLKFEMNTTTYPMYAKIPIYVVKEMYCKKYVANNGYHTLTILIHIVLYSVTAFICSTIYLCYDDYTKTKVKNKLIYLNKIKIELKKLQDIKYEPEQKVKSDKYFDIL